jgi:hypothetical protein
MAAKKQKKTPKPPRVRGKVDVHQPVEKKLTKSDGFIQAQATADPQNQLASQAANLVKTRTTLTSAISKKTLLKAQLDAAQVDFLAADADHDRALRDYVDDAAKLAGGDAATLTALGVDPVSPRDQQIGDMVAAPAKVTVSAGENGGDAVFKTNRIPGAGSYEFQYKLEPSQPSDPWLPGGSTKRVTFTLTGLAAAQHLRVRARAIGNTPGPWSAEVIGIAR